MMKTYNEFLSNVNEYHHNPDDLYYHGSNKKLYQVRIQ